MAALMPHTCQYPALPTCILTCLQEQRQAGQMCDVIIKVGSRSFPAHRGVLCACSGYFKALFTDREASSVELRLVTEKGVSVLLDYMYTARLHLTAGDAQEVMLAAVYLQVSDIMEDCTAYLGHTFQQSQLVGQRSTVSVETIPHGRQDNRENNVSEGGESQSRPRVSRDTSGDAVNHMDQGGSGLDRAHDGRCYPANHYRAGSQGNVGNRLREMHDGRSSSTKHTPDLQSETGNRPEGVHDGISSAANHTSGSETTVEHRQGEVNDRTEVQVNKTSCLQSSQDNSKDVLTSSLITIKQEPEENDATLSSEVEDNPSLVEHHSHSEFPDCSFGASTESFSPAVTTVSSSHSVDRINTIANTLFEQQQEIYDKDSMNIHHQNRAVVPPGNQNMQASLPPFATGGYGPLNSLQGLFPMSSDPLASVDLWSVTSDMRSGSLDTSYYSRPQNKHVCVKCGASFKYASSLRAHKLYKHSNARPFICSTCGYSFKDKSMLKRHSRVHKKRPQSCVSLPSQVGIAAVDKSSCPADSIPVSSSECATPTRAADTSMEKSHSSAAQNEDSLQVQEHSDADTMPGQSGVDGTEAPTRWTTEGGSLLQAGLQDQNNEKEDDGNTFDRTTPPRVDPDTAGSETINQVNMFSTMLPKSTPMLLTSEGVASTTESFVTREGNDLGEDNPRSHQQTTLGHGQAVLTCPSTFRNQGGEGNTAVSNISSFISCADVSTTQNEALFSMIAAGANPSQYHQVAMETPAGMSPKAFSCTECSAVFKYDSSLRAHKLYKHSNARPFVCQDCGYAFKAKGMLLRHRRSQHPKPDGQ